MNPHLENEPALLQVDARDLAVYRFVRQYWVDFGIAPTYREIMEGCKLSSKSMARAAVLRLVQHGLLTKSDTPYISRSVRVTGGKL